MGRETVPLDAVELPGAESEQEGVVEAAHILRMVDRLADEQRAVLLLIAIEDMSYAEAAGVLGVPTGTVMSRLSRARERLRALLAGGNVVALRRKK